MLEQLVYTYIGGRIAGEVAVFDSKVSIVADGPSNLHHNVLCVCKCSSRSSMLQPGHGALTVRTSMLEQLVYTYIGGRIAGEVGIFDSQSPSVVDGPSILHCSVGQECSAIDVAGCTRGYENGSSLKM
jgi:hypothetical protein